MTRIRTSLRRRPAPATVIALLALFVALGGPAQAARLISGKQIRNGSVTSADLKNRSVKVRDLTRGTRSSLRDTPSNSVGSAQLRDGAVGAAQLQPGGVTAAALALNSVSGASLIDRSVGSADLGDNSVTTEKIGPSEVRKADITGGAVGRSELGAGAVSTGEVEDGALTAADIADASGAVTYDFDPIPAGACRASAPLAVPNLKAGETLADDVLLATPPTAWPEYLTFDAVPVSDTEVALHVCNLDTVERNPSSNAFRVLGIDQ